MAVKQIKLGEMLVEAGIIDSFQLNSALSHQRTHGGRLGTSLIKLGYLAEERLLNFLADQLDCPRVDLRDRQIPLAVLKHIPEATARQYNVIPIDRRRQAGSTVLMVAMADPTNLNLIDALQFVSGCRIRPAIATDGMLQEAIDRCYGSDTPPEGSATPPPSGRAPEPAPAGGQTTAGHQGAEAVTADRLARLLDRLCELGVLSNRERLDIELVTNAGVQKDRTGAALQALVRKLHELGILTREDLRELS